MFILIRIVTAALLLAGASRAAPALAAHIVPIDRFQDTAEAAPIREGTCPLRAWPYIG